MSTYQAVIRRAFIVLSVLTWMAAFSVGIPPASAQTNEAAALDQQVEKLLNEGRYSDAIPLAQRALAINERVLGPNHPDIAQSLNNLARLYQSQGRYSDAEPSYKRSLAIREKALGPSHPSVAQSLNNLATLYQSQGRYADAESSYKRSLAIREKAFGPDDPAVATPLNGLAALYTYQDRYADAEPLFKRSLAIREKVLGLDHSDVANSLDNLAVLYQSQGRYADAEPLFKRSLAISEKARGPDHPEVAITLNNLAGLYIRQGRNADAEPLYERSLAIREKALGPDHPAVATPLNGLAVLYQSQGRFADAEPLLKRSLALREKALGPDHPEVASSLNFLAGLYRAQGRYADAEPLYERSLAIREKALDPDSPNVGQSLNNLAALYHNQGRYADAELLYKRSLAIKEKALGPNHPEFAITLNNLAQVYRDQGRYADALPLVRTTAERGFERKQVYLTVLTGAATQSVVTKTEALYESYQIVQQATSSAASNAINQLSVRFAAGNDELAQIVRRDQDLSAENGSIDKSLLAAVSKEPSKRDAAREQQIRDRLQSIAAEHAQITTMLNQRFPDFAALSKPPPIPIKDTQALLADDEALVVLDFSERSYAWVITRTSADWLELKVTAKDVETQVKALRSSLTEKVDKPFDIDAAYRLYQATIGTFADKIASKKRLSVITNGALTSIPLQLLVTEDPAGKSLKDIDWLVRSHAITVLPSVASLKTLRGPSATSSAAKPMIAFADPVFSKMARREAQQQVAMRGLASFTRGTQIDIPSLAEHLPQLPGTRDEVQSIAKALQVEPADIKLGLAATETAVKNAKLDQYRIVYFATHGLVAGDIEKFARGKVEPSLALSFPDMPNDFDDGLLSASEVAQLKLNADWVVLSACNTAAEDKPGAEALSGLARAFFYAGARSLLVSHWEVDDRATADLMTRTFLLMKTNPRLSHGEALRQSTLAIIDNASSDEEMNPRLWAPFIVVGEPASRGEFTAPTK